MSERLTEYIVRLAEIGFTDDEIITALESETGVEEVDA